MYTTYHLKSADELNSDILDAIKVAFKSKPITIIIEEGGNENDLSEEMKAILDERLLENNTGALSSDESIALLSKKYGL